MSYNGWSNWETWAVYTEFNPQTTEEVDEIKEMLEERANELDGFFYSVISDALSKVDWDEIKRAVGGDEEEDEDEED